MFKMDMKNFKKVASDKGTSTFEHSDGHQIQVVHAKLSPKMRAQIAGMPTHQVGGGHGESKARAAKAPQKEDVARMSDGGEVADKKASAPKESEEEQENPKLEESKKTPSNVPSFADGGVAPEANKPFTININTAPQASANPNPLAVEPVYPQDVEPITQPQSAVPQPTPSGPGNFAVEPITPQQAAQEVPQPPVAQGVLIPQGEASGALPSAPAPQAGPQQTAPQAPSDFLGHEASWGMQRAGMEQRAAGSGAEAAGTIEQARARGTAANQAAEQMDTFQTNYQDNYDDIDKERKAVQQDFKDFHIDPQQHIKNMPGGQKIMTAIGLLFSGLGSGLSGQKNMAEEYLNKTIEQNIDAQKAELGKKQNLLSAVMQQYGNLKDSTNVLRLLYRDQVGDMMAEAATKGADQIEQGKRLQKLGGWNIENSNLAQQAAMFRTIGQGAANGTLQPEMMLHAIPEAQKGKATDEIKKVSESIAFRNLALSSFDQLDKIDTLVNRTISPLSTSRATDQIRGEILSKMSKELAGRFTETELHTLKQSLPQWGDKPADVARKRAALNSLLNLAITKQAPTISSFMGNKWIENASQYTPSGQSKFTEGKIVSK
jgi:hypothetical protein